MAGLWTRNESETFQIQSRHVKNSSALYDYDDKDNNDIWTHGTK